MTLSGRQPIPFRHPGSRDRILIIGGGLAGLFTALRLAPLPVTILTLRPLGEGASSAWAQGGIAAAIGEGDTPEAHAIDTITAGAGLCDATVVQLMTSEAPERIDDLLRFGVPFDRDLDGKLRLSREAAHGARRIVRVNGDMAGHAVMKALIAAANRTPSISVLENVQAVDFAKTDGRVIGVYASRGNGNRATFLPARAVVLASGGVGQLFRVTTNPAEAWGSGLAIAARAGAVVSDVEFVQFHPTAFDVGRDPAPLASEAIRGEGALLVNTKGERFMQSVHPDAELAPRDVVARAVFKEIADGQGAFLDCRKLDLEKSFPTAFAVCKAAGIDPTRQPITVAPAAHYHMGGVLTDIRGRTTLTGLWACGEVACTGVHGANRLASNSLLEAVVFGARVAEDIRSEAGQWYAMGRIRLPEDRLENVSEESTLAAEERHEIRSLMFSHLGLLRSGASITTALRTLSKFERTGCSAHVRSMATAGLLIAAGALQRRESRGAHSRTDYPHQMPAITHTMLTLGAARSMSAAVGTDAEIMLKPVRAAKKRKVAV